jgi:hypothetical protein
VAEPSIKGSIVGPMAEELLALRDRGRIDSADLEARLDADALALLERKVDPSSWVPLRTYEQLALVLQLIEGRNDGGYMRARGERAGARLAEAGIYQQLKFVESRRHSTESVELFKTDMRLIMSLQAALLNVGAWSVETDPEHPGRVIVRVREADAIPNCLAEAIEGLFNGLSKRGPHGGLHWTLDRPRRNELRLRMDRDVSQMV